MHLELKPFIGVGDLKFGMTSEEVRKILDKPFNRFSEETGDSFVADSFDYFRIYYNTLNEFYAIEFYRDTECTPIKLIFENIDFLNLNALELVGFFKISDKNAKIDTYGIDSKKYGICIGIDQDENTVQSLLVGNKWYIDDYFSRIFG